MNLYDNFKETIEEKVKDKILMLERQKVCISKYKMLQKYFETVDFDNIDPKEQYRLLTAYDYCQIGKVDKNLTPSNLPTCSNIEPILNDLTPFDTIKLVNTLMGRQDCKQTYIWLDRGYTEERFFDYFNTTFEQYQESCCVIFNCARVKIVCPPDFDDKKTYSEQEISNLVKAKKIFFLNYDIFLDVCSGPSPRSPMTYSILTSLIKTTSIYDELKLTDSNQFVTAKAIRFYPDFESYETQDLKVAEFVPRGIVFDKTPYDWRKLNTYWFEYKNIYANYQRRIDNRQDYINRIQQLYPNFLTEYLKRLANDLPKEISARTKQAKKLHNTIKSTVNESYIKYKQELEIAMKSADNLKEQKLEELEKAQKTKIVDVDFEH